MPKQKINIVWLKRDIRTQDHLPLRQAELSGIPYLIIYCFEPTLISYPDTSVRHLQFIYNSLISTNNKLADYDRHIDICYAESSIIFSDLIRVYDVQQVFSYKESGTEITWHRDRIMSKLLRQHQVRWNQYNKDGVIRGIKNRQNWDKNWYVVMSKPPIHNAYTHDNSKLQSHTEFPLPEDLLEQLVSYPKQYQPAGEENAWKYLRSFTYDRGRNYHRHISKPTESRLSCGRISPYLAWGNISVKQAYQHIKTHKHYVSNKRAFTGIMTRLKWHCHFIQKFEVECRYETACINRGYEDLGFTNDDTYLTAWKKGLTGYPLVDACMRCLTHTGWINFRMRAMLVSFLCYHLDQDWRRGVYHIAQLFLDYEPGIHYPQFQMQAGTTGVNTVRIYNVVKQSQDHDIEGVFIKKWVPELRNVPKEFIHEPWTMTYMDQKLLGVTLGEDYPMPIVDLQTSARAAREKIYGHRKDSKVRKERVRILETHTRRRPNQRDS